METNLFLAPREGDLESVEDLPGADFEAIAAESQAPSLPDPIRLIRGQ